MRDKCLLQKDIGKEREIGGGNFLCVDETFDVILGFNC